jgi:site-specific recombinase XerD
MTQLCRLDLIFEEQLQPMGATLRPRTIKNYRVHVNRLLRYLRLNHPEVHTPGQLQRIHILGWLRSLAEGTLCNDSRRRCLIHIRRLLEDLADNGYPFADGLIFPHDLPPRDQHLPKPVSPEVDRRLKDEMRKTDDLVANALLLMRATGIRVGECLSLTKDSLRHLGQSRWALHVPIGKLHNERWVPMDDDGCKIFNRILSLASSAPSDPSSPLLLLPNGKRISYDRIYHALREASQRAGCPHVRPHQLRHTFATALVRAGLSLSALKEILGHHDIRMTLAYVQVTQNDLQREYHQARQKMASVHVVPQLPNRLDALQTANREIPAICSVLDALKHQLEMCRRHLDDQSANRKLHSLARRIGKIRKSLMEIQKP